MSINKYLKTSLFFFVLSFNLQAHEVCKIKIQSMQSLFNDSKLILKKMNRCIKNVVDKKSQNFFLNVFSNVEGDFIYYHKYQYGTVSFSERLFESMNQRFYYLRHSKSNDKVIFSTKSFKENDDSFLYYRKYKNDEHVIWSTKEFREAKSNFTYFRKYRGDERVLFSMKESFENNDKILYFRSKNGYGREICSIKNGRFRNQFRQEVTIGEFYKLFVSGFWNPLIKHTVYPSIKFISSELDRY